nr:hypothetical protein [Tanacetum cinerariifolium]GFA59934.1 hypothetical protein [Tanacetum cinerariifolium]
MERAITTDASLVVAQDSNNITKTQPMAMSNDLIYQEIGSGYRPRCQETTLEDTDAQSRVLALEEAKTTQDKVITRLKLRVRRLEKKRKDRTLQPMKRRLFKGRVETSTDKSLGEDASKQGRNDDKIEELNLTDGADIEVLVKYKGSGEKGGSTARPEVSTTTPSTPPTTTTIFGDEDLTIAQTLIKLRSKKAKEKGVAFRDVEEPPRLTRSTITLQPLLTIDPKDKGKGVLVEEEPEKLEKVKRRDKGLAQIESDAELAQRIYEEELAELDRAQKERQKQKEATIAALTEEFGEIQARMDTDHELAVRMTHEEQEKYTIEERARLLAEYFKRRKKQLATERAEAIRNKPPTRTQEKKKSVEPKSKGKKGKRIKRVTNSTLKQKSSKKQKMMQEQESAKSDEEESANYKHEKEELRMWLTVVSDEEETIDPEILSTKYPIVDWESQILRNVNMEDVHVYNIIRANRNTKDGIWSNRQDWNLISWKLYENCGVHTLLIDGTLNCFNLLVEKRYPLIKEMMKKMLNWKLEAEAESTMTFELLKFI